MASDSSKIVTAKSNLSAQSKATHVQFKWRDSFNQTKLASAKLHIKDQTTLTDLAILSVSITYKSEIPEEPKVNILIKKSLALGEDEPFEPFHVKEMKLVISKVLPNNELKTYIDGGGNNSDHRV